MAIGGGQDRDVSPESPPPISTTYYCCRPPAWSLIAARCVDLFAPLGILPRGEVFQGDGLFFAAGGLFRFHGDSVFLFLWL